MKLSTFYQSQEWRGLLDILKNERTDANGNIICEYCGKPITRKYDCIGHHKIELTEENVNDYSVSLNPDNISLIHFRCHNEIHKRFEGFKQDVYLVYGSPCSGKSSYVDEVAEPDDLILDIDRIWDAVCNDGRYNKMKGKSGRPHRLRANVFGIRDAIIDQIKTRTGKWRNAYIVGGYPLAVERERLCGILRARPIFVEATLEECLTRCETERPVEWKKYILDWFDAYTE